MAAWLVKSEPHDWSWQNQLAVEAEPWDGVKNAQAQNNMRAMAVGDEVLFYHSGAQRSIVGLCRVVRSAYADPADDSGKYVLVDLAAVRSAETPVDLSAIKADGRFNHLALVRQPRLSVMPVDDASMAALCDMAGLN